MVKGIEVRWTSYGRVQDNYDFYFYNTNEGLFSGDKFKTKLQTSLQKYGVAAEVKEISQSSEFSDNMVIYADYYHDPSKARVEVRVPEYPEFCENFEKDTAEKVVGYSGPFHQSHKVV